jgi:hypothetical protein
MPYTVMVSAPEIRLVRDVWQELTEDRPTIRGPTVTFDPKYGKAILEALNTFELGHMHDQATRQKFANRVTDLCGARLFEIAPKPVDTNLDMFDTSEPEKEPQPNEDATTLPASEESHEVNN